jgi:hypothetical protein
MAQAARGEVVDAATVLSKIEDLKHAPRNRVIGEFALSELAESDMLTIWAYLSDHHGDANADKAIRHLCGLRSVGSISPSWAHSQRPDKTPASFCIGSALPGDL